MAKKEKSLSELLSLRDRAQFFDNPIGAAFVNASTKSIKQQVDEMKQRVENNAK